MQITTTKKYHKNCKKGDKKVEYQYVTIRVTGALKHIRKSEEAISNQHQRCDTENDHRESDDNHTENMRILDIAEPNKQVSFADKNIVMEKESNEGFD